MTTTAPIPATTVPIDQSNIKNQQIQNIQNSNSNSNNNSINNQLNGGAKFQCNLCPCKYKRSNDLSKHLKLKHSVNLNNLSEYLKLKQQNQIDQDTVESNLDDDVNGNSNNGLGGMNGEYENDDDDVYPNESDDEQQYKNYNHHDLNSNQMRSNGSSSMNSRNNNQSNMINGSYECPYCSYFSNGNDNEYILHVKDHLCGKAFRCVLCNSVYKYRGDCVVHLKRKHQKADMIAHSYVDRFNLDTIPIQDIYSLLKAKQTEDVENEEKLFGCAFCDYKANYKGDVYKHQTRRHPGTPKSVNTLAGSNLNSSYASDNNYSLSGTFMNSNNSLNRTNMNYTSNNNNTENDESYYGNDDNDTLNENDQNGLGDEMIDDGPIEDEMGMNQDEECLDEDDEDFFNERPQKNQQFSQATNDLRQPSASSGDFQCKFCPFVAKNHAKLQLHLSTHYNLKKFMCPICNRRANFKWDIQKHLKKIHNDHHSEVIILSESEARSSIGNYIETKQFNIPKKDSETTAQMYDNSTNDSNEEPSGAANNINDNNNHISTFNNNGHSMPTTASVGRDRKYKCSLCMRLSKWQWDIRKHLRTVHKGQEGDVVVLDEQEIKNNLANYPQNNIINNNNVNNSSNNSPVVKNETHFQNNHHLPAPVTQQCNSIGTDTTGNKKFKCTLCVYRSNWKADLFRHLKKRHAVLQPSIEDVIVLSVEEASSTLEEYERLHGINIRKRARIDADVYSASLTSNQALVNPIINNVNTNFNNNMNQFNSVPDKLHQEDKGILHSKRFKTDSSSIMSSSSSASSSSSFSYSNNLKKSEPVVNYYPQNGNTEPSEPEPNEIGEHGETVERLPVSIAELNIKPYKCIKCGFRSDRKSDTLRHIRVKHTPQAFNCLRILSIKEASETIKQYEMVRSSRRSRRSFNPNNTTLDDTNKSLNISATMPTITPTLNQVQVKTVNDPQIDVSSIGKPTAASLTVQQPIFSNKKNIGEIIKQTNKETKPLRSRLSSLDYYKCPFCSFKHVSKIVMRSHLGIHFKTNGCLSFNSTHQSTYRCNVCMFKSEWRYTVKQHIYMCHPSVAGANVVKISLGLNNDSITAKKSIESVHAPVVEQQIQQQMKEEKDSNSDLMILNDNDEDKRSVCTASTNGEPVLLTESKLFKASNKKIFTNANSFGNLYNRENDDFMQYDENNDNDDAADADDDAQNKLIVDQGSFNENEDFDRKNQSLLYDEDDNSVKKTVESVVLTGYDGKQFTTTFLVANSSSSYSQMNNTFSATGFINNSNSPINKKKMYYCQTCPYKTNNYCNLKQHLLQHTFREGFFKCRYCPYFVVMIRLLKQHEILHLEYVPRENVKENQPLL